MRIRTTWCLWLQLLRGSFRGAAAALANITVDDNDPTISYLPSDDWSFGPTCSTCTVHVEANQTFDGTWHDTLYASLDPAESTFQTMEYTFTGSAVYVYGILSNALDNPSGNADQLFFIDNQQVGMFTHIPTGDGSFVYNFLLYGNGSILNGEHTLKMQNGQPGNLSSLILFDKLVYTNGEVETPSSSSSASSALSTAPSPSSSGPTSTSGTSTSSPTGSVFTSNSKSSTARTALLAVLIPMFALLAAIAAAVWYRRRQHRLRQDATPSYHPFPLPVDDSGNGRGPITMTSGKAGMFANKTLSPNSAFEMSSVSSSVNAPIAQDDAYLVTAPSTSSLTAVPIAERAPGASGTMAPMMFAPISLSHFTSPMPADGFTTGQREMPGVVFAPVSTEQMSNRMGYPLLGAWSPQAGIARSEGGTAPPAYEFEDGSAPRGG